MTDRQDQLEEFKASADAGVRWLTASTEAQCKWLDTVANYCLKRVQAVREEIAACADLQRLAMLRATAHEYQLVLDRLDRERWKAGEDAKRVGRRAKDLGLLLVGTKELVSITAGYCALRFFLINIPGPAAELTAELGRAWYEGETVGGLIRRLDSEHRVPDLGTAEWAAVARVVAILGKAAEDRMRAIEQRTRELETASYAVWGPQQIASLIGQGK